jgi:hypothetical protein
VSERCPECEGAGHIYVVPGCDADPCMRCNGTGDIAADGPTVDHAMSWCNALETHLAKVDERLDAR